MRLTALTLLVLMVTWCSAKEEDESNELSSSRPKNLDSDLRRALLKALTELENEDEGTENDENEDRIVEKASASAVSIYANSESANKPPSITTTATPETKETKKPIIVVQKSQGIQHAPITTVEKEALDPYFDAEQILTSASSSFTLPSQESPTKSVVEVRSSSASNNNLIKTEEKVTTKLNKVVTTTVAPVVSTEENEAKVEDVQFFSAPLVAAFTVHQDEQGIPKKVEPIYKSVLSKKPDELKLEQSTKRQEISQLQNQKQQEVSTQLVLQQKQKALEDEIARLNLSLKQQQQLNHQQQEYFLRLQQEQLRIRNNAQPFRPMTSPSLQQQLPILNQHFSTTTEKAGLNQFITNSPVSSQQLPVKPAQVFSDANDKTRNPVSLLPSITYDPLIEAGKLPINAQILPIKAPVNFHAPIIQTAGFQQFHSLPHNTPLVNFNQLSNLQSQFSLGENQRHRFFRQEAGVGNFINNDVNSNYPAFSIQKSVQPTQQNNFPGNNLASNFNAFVLPAPQQNNRFFRSNAQTQSFQQPQNNRFFRSNLESSLNSPNNYYQQSNLNNYQLRNLLYNSGAIREKSPVDINIISKVLSFNHSGNDQFFSSRRKDDFVKEV